jgi:hypothetical protein
MLYIQINLFKARLVEAYIEWKEIGSQRPFLTGTP